jgi:hypothetical protein
MGRCGERLLPQPWIAFQPPSLPTFLFLVSKRLPSICLIHFLTWWKYLKSASINWNRNDSDLKSLENSSTILVFQQLMRKIFQRIQIGESFSSSVLNSKLSKEKICYNIVILFLFFQQCFLPEYLIYIKLFRRK